MGIIMDQNDLIVSVKVLEQRMTALEKRHDELSTTVSNMAGIVNCVARDVKSMKYLAYLSACLTCIAMLTVIVVSMQADPAIVLEAVRAIIQGTTKL